MQNNIKCEHEPVLIQEVGDSYYIVCKLCGERTYHNYLSKESAWTGWNNMIEWEESDTK
jgi:hypothetical protein